MALDGLVISNIVYELSETLTGGRINKIYQPEPDAEEDGICNTMRAGEPDVKEYDWFWAMRDRR